MLRRQVAFFLEGLFNLSDYTIQQFRIGYLQLRSHIPVGALAERLDRLRRVQGQRLEHDPALVFHGSAAYPTVQAFMEEFNLRNRDQIPFFVYYNALTQILRFTHHMDGLSRHLTSFDYTITVLSDFRNNRDTTACMSMRSMYGSIFRLQELADFFMMDLASVTRYPFREGPDNLIATIRVRTAAWYATHLRRGMSPVERGVHLCLAHPIDGESDQQVDITEVCCIAANTREQITSSNYMSSKSIGRLLDYLINMNTYDSVNWELAMLQVIAFQVFGPIINSYFLVQRALPMVEFTKQHHSSVLHGALFNFAESKVRNSARLVSNRWLLWVSLIGVFSEMYSRQRCLRPTPKHTMFITYLGYEETSLLRDLSAMLSALQPGASPFSALWQFLDTPHIHSDDLPTIWRAMAFHHRHMSNLVHRHQEDPLYLDIFGHAQDSLHFVHPLLQERIERFRPFLRHLLSANVAPLPLSPSRTQAQFNRSLALTLPNDSRLWDAVLPEAFRFSDPLLLSTNSTWRFLQRINRFIPGLRQTLKTAWWDRWTVPAHVLRDQILPFWNMGDVISILTFQNTQSPALADLYTFLNSFPREISAAYLYDALFEDRDYSGLTALVLGQASNPDDDERVENDSADGTDLQVETESVDKTDLQVEVEEAMVPVVEVTDDGVMIEVQSALNNANDIVMSHNDIGKSEDGEYIPTLLDLSFQTRAHLLKTLKRASIFELRMMQTEMHEDLHNILIAIKHRFGIKSPPHELYPEDPYPDMSREYIGPSDSDAFQEAYTNLLGNWITINLGSWNSLSLFDKTLVKGFLETVDREHIPDWKDRMSPDIYRCIIELDEYLYVNIYKDRCPLLFLPITDMVAGNQGNDAGVFPSASEQVMEPNTLQDTVSRNDVTDVEHVTAPSELDLNAGNRHWDIEESEFPFPIKPYGEVSAAYYYLTDAQQKQVEHILRTFTLATLDRLRGSIAPDVFSCVMQIAYTDNEMVTGTEDFPGIEDEPSEQQTTQQVVHSSHRLVWQPPDLEVMTTEPLQEEVVVYETIEETPIDPGTSAAGQTETPNTPLSADLRDIFGAASNNTSTSNSLNLVENPSVNTAAVNHSGRRGMDEQSTPKKRFRSDFNSPERDSGIQEVTFHHGTDLRLKTEVGNEEYDSSDDESDEESVLSKPASDAKESGYDLNSDTTDSFQDEMTAAHKTAYRTSSHPNSIGISSRRGRHKLIAKDNSRLEAHELNIIPNTSDILRKVSKNTWVIIVGMNYYSSTKIGEYTYIPLFAIICKKRKDTFLWYRADQLAARLILANRQIIWLRSLIPQERFFSPRTISAAALEALNSHPEGSRFIIRGVREIPEYFRRPISPHKESRRILENQTIISAVATLTERFIFDVNQGLLVHPDHSLSPIITNSSSIGIVISRHPTIPLTKREAIQLTLESQQGLADPCHVLDKNGQLLSLSTLYIPEKQLMMDDQTPSSPGSLEGSLFQANPATDSEHSRRTIGMFSSDLLPYLIYLEALKKCVLAYINPNALAGKDLVYQEFNINDRFVIQNDGINALVRDDLGMEVIIIPQPVQRIPSDRQVRDQKGNVIFFPPAIDIFEPPNHSPERRITMVTEEFKYKVMHHIKNSHIVYLLDKQFLESTRLLCRFEAMTVAFLIWSQNQSDRHQIQPRRSLQSFRLRRSHLWIANRDDYPRYTIDPETWPNNLIPTFFTRAHSRFTTHPNGPASTDSEGEDHQLADCVKGLFQVDPPSEDEA